MRLDTQAPNSPMTEQTRWHLKVSNKADRQVRSFLAERGYKKGDLSRFVEEAVCWRVLDRTTEDFRDRFSDLDDEEIDRLSEEAVRFARLARR